MVTEKYTFRKPYFFTRCFSIGKSKLLQDLSFHNQLKKPPVYSKQQIMVDKIELIGRCKVAADSQLLTPTPKWNEKQLQQMQPNKLS